MNKFKFDFAETRVLGSLIEKRFLTPEHYPLTLNSLVTACNQKSSRNPVTSLSENEVVAALDNLRLKNVVGHVITSRLGSSKYQYEQGSLSNFDVRELAAICVLLLRGPQTLGEIRGRTERIYSFADVPEVREVIEKLAAHENGPFVKQLEKEPGRKERRYCHLFSDPPIIESKAADANKARQGQESIFVERIDSLEKEVEELKYQLGQVIDILNLKETVKR